MNPHSQTIMVRGHWYSA